MADKAPKMTLVEPLPKFHAMRLGDRGDYRLAVSGVTLGSVVKDKTHGDSMPWTWTSRDGETGGVESLESGEAVLARLWLGDAPRESGEEE